MTHISQTDDYKFALYLASKLDDKFGNTQVVCSQTRQIYRDVKLDSDVQKDNKEVIDLIECYLKEILPITYSYSVYISDDSDYRIVRIDIKNKVSEIHLTLTTFVIHYEEKEIFADILFKGDNEEYPSFIVVYGIYDWDQWVDTTDLKKAKYN